MSAADQSTTGASAVAAAAADADAPNKSTEKAKTKRKEPLRRPRGKRGGVKHQKKMTSSLSTGGKPTKGEATGPSTHSLLIAAFHTLEKKLAQTKDEKERQKLIEEREALGGLKAYQDASLLGADRKKGGESGKWIADALRQVSEAKDFSMLDVGALSGTAYSRFPWIRATCIDLNPRGPDVQQADFLKMPVPAADANKYDAVSLSLVLNFVGDIQERGRMLLHAHKYIRKDGYLALILPLACVNNSRYCTHERLQGILASCGWKVVHQDDSQKLARYILQETGKKWDKKVWKKEEVKVGVQLNNFCIVVKPL